MAESRGSSSDGPRGRGRRGDGRQTGRRDDRSRPRQGGGRDRGDSRDRRSSFGGGSRRGYERRAPTTAEDEKYSKISDEEFKGKMNELILQDNLLETGFGARRFYFATRDGRIPFLDISEDLAGRLINGMAGIVEKPGEGVPEYAIVPTGMVRKIQKVDPERIRFFNAEY